MVRLEEVCSRTPISTPNEQRSNDHCGRGKSSLLIPQTDTFRTREVPFYSRCRNSGNEEICLEVVNELQHAALLRHTRRARSLVILLVVES